MMALKLLSVLAVAVFLVVSGARIEITNNLQTVLNQPTTPPNQPTTPPNVPKDKAAEIILLPQDGGSLPPNLDGPSPPPPPGSFNSPPPLVGSKLQYWKELQRYRLPPLRKSHPNHHHHSSDEDSSEENSVPIAKIWQPRFGRQLKLTEGNPGLRPGSPQEHEFFLPPPEGFKFPPESHQPFPEELFQRYQYGSFSPPPEGSRPPYPPGIYGHSGRPHQRNHHETHPRHHGGPHQPHHHGGSPQQPHHGGLHQPHHHSGSPQPHHHRGSPQPHHHRGSPQPPTGEPAPAEESRYGVIGPTTSPILNP